jgi:hypothetical protein
MPMHPLSAMLHPALFFALSLTSIFPLRMTPLGYSPLTVTSTFVEICYINYHYYGIIYAILWPLLKTLLASGEQLILVLIAPRALLILAISFLDVRQSASG